MKFVYRFLITLLLIIPTNQRYFQEFFISETNLVKELNCLTAAIYFEARSEISKAQEAVANIIINRTKSGKYPRSICKVISQPRQFAWYSNKNTVRKVLNRSTSDLTHLDTLAYQQAKMISLKVLNPKYKPIPELKHSLYFLTKDYTTIWSLKFTKVITIGNLDFYQNVVFKQHYGLTPRFSSDRV
jgi:spore germination cell wall hydrolase CwlJ-like protein